MTGDRARFHDRVVLVTGGATGIGRAVAVAFAQEGAAVMIGDVDERARETVAAIESVGGRAEWRSADVTIAAEIEALVAECVTQFGGLHVAFNNAGITPPFGPLHEAEESDFDRTMAVNAKGVFFAMRAEIRHMLDHGGGAIVNTGSVGSLIAHPDMSAYIASKHAVAGLTKAAAVEYARRGIRVNAICPGFTRTAMTADWCNDPAFLDAFFAGSPIGRWAEPREMAGTVLHLASDDASYVNGSIVVVDGGQTSV